VDDILQPDPAGTPPPRGGSRNVFQVLWQHRGLILLGLVVGTTLGLLNYSQRSPVYRATAQVLVVKKQAANALPVAGGDPRMAVMEDYVSTHLIVIRSPIIIDRAVRKRNLGALKSLQGGDPVGLIQAGLVATREVNKDAPSTAGNNVINLSYSGSDPGDVEAVLSAVIESYKDFLDETYQNTSRTTVELIEKAANTLSKDLARKEVEYRAFRQDSPLLILGENGVPVHQSKILEYQKKETEAREQVAAIKKRIEEVEKAVTEKQPREVVLALAERKYEKGAASPKTNKLALETALLPLVQEEADLAAFYGPDHPAVIRARKRIEDTKDFYRRLDDISREGETTPASADPVQAALQGLRMELRLATAHHQWIKGLLDEEVLQARRLEAYYDRDRGYRDDIGRTQKVLDETLKRLQAIDLVRDYGGFDAKPITPPCPGMKVAPVFWQFLLMGGALGLLLGSGAAYLLDLADKSFRTPEEVRRRLGLPIVGHVPFVPAAADPVEATDAAGNAVELDPGLLAFHRPASPEAEAFRGIRTALYFGTHGQRHKVIQVTSPNMGDGKTTLITNLAVSIAQSGRKVLLVDADLRRPRIHRAFGLAGRVGLAEVIAGGAELGEAIQVTVVPNLSVLPCGRRPSNPAELLTSPRFEDVLDDVRGAFDYVLVDSPPLLAVSDPCTVASRMDGLLLTIRVSKNGRPAAERARDLLTGLRVNCLGVVVNGVGKHGAMSGYGYDHYRYADEYTSGYTATDHDPSPEPAAQSARQSGVPPTDRPAPALAGPSANGHAAHPVE
jgi:capsular exopolysaccharide synthesis family protein